MSLQVSRPAVAGKSYPLTYKAICGALRASSRKALDSGARLRDLRLVANTFSTAGAQSGPRLACPLYVWKTMQVNDWELGVAPRASTGRAQLMGSFLRSFTFRQVLAKLMATGLSI